jgi:hypothetical protein
MTKENEDARMIKKLRKISQKAEKLTDTLNKLNKSTEKIAKKILKSKKEFTTLRAQNDTTEPTSDSRLGSTVPSQGGVGRSPSTSNSAKPAKKRNFTHIYAKGADGKPYKCGNCRTCLNPLLKKRCVNTPLLDTEKAANNSRK